MRRLAKAMSAFTFDRSASSAAGRDAFSFATRGASPGVDGSSAPSAGRARLAILGLALFSLLALLGAFAPVAGAVPYGITGSFGNPDATGSTLGGRFSTTPQGVAVNDGTGDVYIADAGNNRIQMFDSLGVFQWAIGLDVVQQGRPDSAAPVNEIQTVSLASSITGGTFTLRFGGTAAANTSTAINWDADAAAVRAALETIAALTGNVDVTSSNPGGGVLGGPWTVEFTGALADADVAQMTSVNSGLVGSPRTISIATTTVGAAAAERCTIAEDCKEGLASNSVTAAGIGGAIVDPSGVAINQTTGDFYVTSTNTGWRRVDQFTAGGTWVRSWGPGVVATGSGEADERQNLVVDASSGTYRLAPVTGLAGGVTVTNGSREITLTTAPSFGAFNIGDEVTLATTAGVSNVAAGTTITACTPDCVAPTRLTLSNAATAGGSNRVLTGFGATTADIAYDASPDTGADSVQARLEDLPGIDPGDVTVEGGPGSAGGSTPYLITFGGRFAATDISQVAVREGSVALGGGGASATIATVNHGAVGLEVCTVAANCKAGQPGSGTGIEVRQSGYPAVAPAGAPNEGNVLFGDSGRRVLEFTSTGEFVRTFGVDVVALGSSNRTVDLNEFQSVSIGGPFDFSCFCLRPVTGGTFTLTFDGQTTNPIAWDAAAAQVDQRLEDDLANIGAGDVDVTGPAGGPWTVEFAGALGGRDVAQMTGNAASLLPAGSSASISTPNPGGTFPDFEVCRAVSFDACSVGSGNGGSRTGQFDQSSASRPTPESVAVDTGGNVYTVENTKNFRAQKFTPSGGSLTPALFDPNIGGAETLSGAGATSTPTDVAVDTKGDVNPANDNLFFVKAFPAGAGIPSAARAERRVLQLDTAGALVETHLPNAGLNSVNGLAIKAGGEPGYLTSAAPRAGFYEIGVAIPPTPTIEPTTDVTTVCATLHGRVNPNGGNSLRTSYRFEYSGNGGSTWTQIPTSPIDVGNGTNDVEVEQTPCGLEPNKDYLVRLVAIKGGTPVNSTGNDGDFRTLAAPPITLTFPAYWDSSAQELVLRGGINPNNSDTTYYFQYGIEPCATPGACESVPVSEDASAGSGGQQVSVSTRLSGLAAETTYHYRLIADNGVGGAPVEGVERLLTTPGVECDNEEMRVANDSTELPQCRALEWASNGDSWGAGIGGLRAGSADGDRAQFMAFAFNDPDSSPAGLGNPYTAVREDDRWRVYSALPPGDRAYAGGTLGIFWSAPDLRKILWPGVSPGLAFQGKGNWLIEGIDGTSIDAHQSLVPLSRVGPPEGLAQWTVDAATPDLSEFIFRLNSRQANQGEIFFPDEPMNTGSNNGNLYQISDAGTPDSKFELVNRATDPSPGVPGPQIGGTCGARGHGISDAGDIAFFSVRPNGVAVNGACNSPPESARRLFKRVDSTQTVQVSQPTCSRVESLPATPGCGRTGASGTPVPDSADSYQGNSSDGSIVFFVTARQLTDSDTDAGNDLYLYDESPPDGEPRLVQVSAGEATADHPTVGFGAGFLSVVGGIGVGTAPGIAGDGSRVYFTATGRLVDEATQGRVNLYVYQRDGNHEGGRIEHVATLDSNFTFGDSGLAPNTSDGDGRTLLLTTATRLLAEDADSSVDVYRYDDETGELLCASCMGDGSFNATIPLAFGVGGSSIADDGSMIAFTTREALLVDDDLNGASDVYIWNEGGVLGLASAGSGQHGASGGFVSADGESVFFTTRAPLYPGDTNNANDVYVARVNGGFPLPEEKPICAGGEECQGAGSEAPGANSAGSADFFGAGNPPTTKPKSGAKRCRGGKVRRGGRCVAKGKLARRICRRKRGAAKRRCIRNQIRRLDRAQKNQRRAGHNRGGNR